MREQPAKIGIRLAAMAVAVLLAFGPLGLTASAAPVAFAAEAPSVASGTVTDAGSGLPVAGVTVSAAYFDAASGDWLAEDEVVTGPNGSFTLHDHHGYGAGEYAVTVSGGGYVTRTERRTWDGVTPLGVDFSVPLARAVASGVATDAATALPVPGAFIAAEWRDPATGLWWQTGYALTGAQGRYTVYDTDGRGAGDYRVSAAAPGHVPTSTVGVWDGVNALPMSFTLRSMPTMSSGVVSDSSSGLPIEGARVWAEYYDPGSEDWVASGETTSGVDGRYVLLDSFDHQAGTYRLKVAAGGHLLGSATVAWDGSTPLDTDFALAPTPALVAGKVTDKVSGTTIAGAGVTLEAYDAETAEWRTAASMETAGDGTYRLSAEGCGPGEYRVSVTATGHVPVQRTMTWTGDATLSADFVLRPETSFISLAGSDRYQTAVLVSKDAFPGSGDADAVVVATGVDWPDALGASALAGAYNAPVLLTKTAALPPSVVEEIRRLGVHRAFIIGSPLSVSEGVETSVAALVGGEANVTRLQGVNRYATAAVVAGEVKKRMTELGRWDGRAFVTTGRNFPDALAASPLSAAKGMPILLVSDTLPDAVADSLQSLDPDGIVVLGSGAAVSSTVATSLQKFAPVTRLEGNNRYETAARIVGYASDAGLGWDGLAIATGDNFPDALAGGAARGIRSSLVLLTPTKSLHPLVHDALVAHKEDVYSARFLGDTPSVSEAVRGAVSDALR